MSPNCKSTWLRWARLASDGGPLSSSEERASLLSLDEDAVSTWEDNAEIAQQAERLSSRLKEYQAERSGHYRPFPGMRYVLLHSLAHALIRRLCLNAGYSSSALRERIYSASGDTPMAGLLI